MLNITPYPISLRTRWETCFNFAIATRCFIADVFTRRFDLGQSVGPVASSFSSRKGYVRLMSAKTKQRKVEQLCLPFPQVRSHPYWSYSLKGVFLLILPCVVALLVQVTIPILWLFDRKVIHIPGFNRAREMDSTAIFSLMATLLLATAVFCNVVRNGRSFSFPLFL